MPLFALFAKDKPDALERRMAVRPTHLAYLESRGDKLVFGGATQSEAIKPTGSMVVIEAADLAEATAFFEGDPYVKADVFESITITRWNWVINNPGKRGQ